MTCASLAMYDMLAPVREGNDRLWHFVRGRLRASGFGAPDDLDRLSPYDAPWHDPGLVLAQACGYPYITALRGKVRLVATPVYAFPGGEGTSRASYVVVAERSAATRIEDLRGTTAAINDPASNSGMNLLRAMIAPLAASGRFFSDVIVTGGHLASLEAVRTGRASVAAVDTVTFGLLERHAQQMVKGVRILTETPRGPGLPFITRIDASDGELPTLRAAIADAIADPSLGLSQSLGLVGLEILGDRDYLVLDVYRQQAEAACYPAIA
ncbi:PhnD/SsuA/transferrin family substrate-binding protein [Rhizobium sp. S-51]|uniref:PhnD/SsuA/transferrin family substrate-binding protein n=1 Tax=Rhizobium terricola TaxID=2728849 RepID=A0A7Y0AX58_9HYPH|nr:PhnD/SsuA/transferrin family substrate-binding protein [Rhizobium terricola]NML75112.1 PhnD/SsuA/transferrin family substrate-binding protein [Rhizobium terricola]